MRLNLSAYSETLNKVILNNYKKERENNVWII